MKERFVSEGGIVTDAYFDDEGVTLKQTQRVDGIAEEFRRLSETPNKKAFGAIAASVPIEVHYRWMREWETKHRPVGDIDLKAFLAMKLNSSEGAPYRNQRVRG